MTAVPEAIGRYRVIQVLGSGGFATVYLAEDPRLDAKVAIKVLADNMAADPGLRTRFIDEARVMRRLAAPGLVTVHDIDEHEGRPYFVMEYCAGGTLADRLAALGRPLRQDEGRQLAAALLRSTAGIHKAGVVHRDLKPGNYLIRRIPTGSGSAIPGVLHVGEELVVADFGLAKAVDPQATRLSIAGGTPGYSAPEQFRGDPTVDTRADVYALSAIAVWAVTGRRPDPVMAPSDRAFDDATLASTGDLAVELARGLSFDREVRQRDVIEWHRALTSSGGLGEGAPPTRKLTDPTPTPQPESSGTDPEGRQRSGRGLRLLAVVMLVVTVLGGVGALALTTGRLALPGPSIHGPVVGTVDVAATFALEGSGAATWSVNGREVASGRIVSLTPTEPGTYRITASSGMRSSTIIYDAEPATGSLRIDGPGLAPVGQPTVYAAAGSEATSYTWTLDGEQSQGRSIEIRPTGPGAITIQLTTPGGETVRRTVTAAAGE